MFYNLVRVCSRMTLVRVRIRINLCFMLLEDLTVIMNALENSLLIKNVISF